MAACKRRYQSDTQKALARLGSIAVSCSSTAGLAALCRAGASRGIQAIMFPRHRGSEVNGVNGMKANIMYRKSHKCSQSV